jgi:peptidoglycan lytic transglycosylase
VIRRAIAAFAALIGAWTLALCMAGAGTASSGGSGMGPGTRAADGSGAVQPTAQPGDLTVTSSGAGMTITSRASTLLRNGLGVSGTLPARDAGKVVDVELMGAKTGWAWKSAAQTQVQSDGSFSAVWQTNHIGRFAVRAIVQSDPGATASSGAPTVTVTVYRPSLATLYGPGFYGRRTACGTVLRHWTVGVANRTLPCGTPVAIYYQGQMMIVPVIDRGPYANGADWDLTMAAGRALGMDATASLGAVSLPRVG